MTLDGLTMVLSFMSPKCIFQPFHGLGVLFEVTGIWICLSKFHLINLLITVSVDNTQNQLSFSLIQIINYSCLIPKPTFRKLCFFF